jgi:hypothetical protein
MENVSSFLVYIRCSHFCCASSAIIVVESSIIRVPSFYLTFLLDLLACSILVCGYIFEAVPRSVGLDLFQVKIKLKLLL